MMKLHVVLFPAVLLSAGVLDAQIFPPVDAPEKTPSSKREAPGFWQATLAGGEYVVATDRITSVSRHSYLLDSSLMVDEVTVDTVGQALARFYFITPVGADAGGKEGGTFLEQGKRATDIAGQKGQPDVDTTVIKKYPTTTHARTVEYRIATREELTNLFNSAREAWISGKGGRFEARPAK